jgi:hypothetical protein
MKYIEPVRMRDEIAMELFGKTFEELAEEEKMQVHNKAVKLKGVV